MRLHVLTHKGSFARRTKIKDLSAVLISHLPPYSSQPDPYPQSSLAQQARCLILTRKGSCWGVWRCWGRQRQGGQRDRHLGCGGELLDGAVVVLGRQSLQRVPAVCVQFDDLHEERTGQLGLRRTQHLVPDSR
uniref:Uncharacterized protein n=1 Tax=Takifugu rubripes TaxID=31033 RepID=A0A3B5K664_TAKRU